MISGGRRLIYYEGRVVCSLNVDRGTNVDWGNDSQGRELSPAVLGADAAVYERQLMSPKSCRFAQGPCRLARRTVAQMGPV